MAALLYFVTSAALLLFAHRWFTRLTSGAALGLVLLPLCFTGGALLTNRIYAPVEMSYLTHPLVDHRDEMRVGTAYNGRLADIAFQLIPWREATRRAIAEGEWPLLNRFELCGDMLTGSGQPATFSPFTLIALLLPATISFTFTAAIAFFVAGLGAFLLARELGCSVEASMFAAAGWMFSSPVALQILWPLGFAWNLLPLVLAATLRLIRIPDRRSIGLLAVALSLEILAGHPETLLHVTAIGLAFALFEMFTSRPDRFRVLVAGAIGAIVAAGISAIYLLPFLDAMNQTIEHLIRAELFGRSPLNIPEHFVRESLLGDFVPWLRPERWHLPGDAVAGSIVFALAVYAIVFVRTRRTMFFAGLAMACLLFGSHVWPFAQVLHALPLFRQALNERLATAVPLAYSILAAFAIDRLEMRKAALICGAMATLFVVVAAGGWPIADLHRFAAELGPLLALTVVLGVSLRSKATLATLFAFFLVQRMAADGRMIPTHDSRVAFPRLALFKPIEGIAAPFRITGNDSVLIPNTATMYGVEDVRGNTPMNLAALSETFPMWSTIPRGNFHSTPDLTRPILSMMNVRFGLIDVSDPIPPGWHSVAVDVWTRLIENERVLPRAFIPRSVRTGRTPQQELDEMSGETDFTERSWLRVGNQPHERANGEGVVSVSRKKSGLAIDVMKYGDGYVVVSEAAWRGWRAYLDGQRVTSHRANHAFLAVFVPAGHHRIELRFLPQSFVVGRTITFATLLICAVALVVATRR
jgi:membrane protein YfhO